MVLNTTENKTQNLICFGNQKTRSKTKTPLDSSGTRQRSGGFPPAASHAIGASLDGISRAANHAARDSHTFPQKATTAAALQTEQDAAQINIVVVVSRTEPDTFCPQIPAQSITRSNI